MHRCCFWIFIFAPFNYRRVDGSINFRFEKCFIMLFRCWGNFFLISIISIIFSQIYCEGPILQAVQDGRLFADSKYFVDMPLKQDPSKTLSRVPHINSIGKKWNSFDRRKTFVKSFCFVYSNHSSRLLRTWRNGEGRQCSTKVCRIAFWRAGTRINRDLSGRLGKLFFVWIFSLTFLKVPFPNSFLQIEDYKLRRWALHLHRIWRDLCRKVFFFLLQKRNYF